MNTMHSSIPVAEVPVYARLQREMHDALLAQHPEWILPNGDSPTCRFYDARFAKVLTSLARMRAVYRERAGKSAIKPIRYFDQGNMAVAKGLAAATNVLLNAC
jgi:hypothetical protein